MKDISVPTDHPETDVGIDLIDHHCHGVVTHDLEHDAFEQLLSESYRPPPAGTSQFDKPLGLMVRRYCAPLLDLEPLVSGQRYVERRRELGALEVNRRLLRDCGLACLVVDTGHRGGEIADVPEMSDLSAKPAFEVVRIEAVAEEVKRNGATAESFARDFADELDRRSVHAAGLKTIAAYRVTFRIDQTAPTETEVSRGIEDWYRKCDEHGAVRMDNVDLVRFGLWRGAELCQDRKFPLQIHVGFGDPDIYMQACDPTCFTDFLRSMEELGVDCTLLHNYPFQRQAAWLAEIFRNVYFDVGVILNFAGPQAQSVMGEGLEIGPFFKQLYSSDAFGLAELYYLGQFQFRRTLKACLDSWIANDMCNTREADRIVAMIARGNAMRIYDQSLGDLNAGRT